MIAPPRRQLALAPTPILKLGRLSRQLGVEIYTVEAFGGLADALAHDAKVFGQRLCLIHTGGLFGVYPYRDRRSRLLDRPAQSPA